VKKKPVSTSSKKKQSKANVHPEKLNKKTDLDTLGTWLDKQKDHELEKGTFRSFTEGKMPTSTTQDWLSKQKGKEQGEIAEVVAEIVMPTSTTEAWISRQVSERISLEEEEKPVQPTPQQQ